MKSLGVTLVLVGLVSAAAPALAQSSTFTIYGDLVGGDYVWTDGAGKTNPPISVTPGAEITATIISKDGLHKARIGAAESEDVDSDAETTEPDTTTFTFTAKDTGSDRFVCPYHTKMVSTVYYGAAPADANGGTENKSPGVALFGVALALLGAALLLRRK